LRFSERRDFWRDEIFVGQYTIQNCCRSFCFRLFKGIYNYKLKNHLSSHQKIISINNNDADNECWCWLNQQQPPEIVAFVGYSVLYLLVAAAVPPSAKPTKNKKIMILILLVFSFIVYYYRQIRIQYKIWIF